MSKREEKPLFQIKENEELNLENTDGKRNKENHQRVKKTSSVKSNGPVSPLIRAVRRGSSSTSLFLLEANLNDLDVKKTDNFQRNVFHYAVSRPDTLRAILNQLKTNTSVQEALNQPDDEGHTPIHCAASIPNVESLEILNEYDSSLMKLKTTVKKRSVLHLAVKSRSEYAVDFVLSKDPDIIDCVDSLSQTPAHYAAALKQSSILELLITKGCETATADADGQLPVHIAASKGLRCNVVHLLRDDPDFVNKVNNLNQSLLLLAAKNGFCDVVSYLLSKNADHELKDKSGLTAFDWAVKRSLPEVVKVFLGKNIWKEVVRKSSFGPEGCLAAMIKNMPEMATLLLDKCRSHEGSKDHPDSYKVMYDFFCLESKDENSDCPRFEALDKMAENVSEIGLCHPVVVKYVDIKWRKRGFKYTIALIFRTLLFHICLMVYTTRVIGVVKKHQETKENGGRNSTIDVVRREGRRPDADEMMALRIIMLIVTFVSTFKDAFQLMVQRFQYFCRLRHYYRLGLFISVICYLLPVNGAITDKQIQFGAVAVLLSWVNLIQFLQLIPVLGAYIIVVHKVFWTLMKICIVVAIYLLSFASTFYVLLAEHDSFRNIVISFISTFVAMTDGVTYEELFVTMGWYPTMYELKMTVLVLFMLTMSIVVNNALIGLAVGDANEVMKSASVDKFRRRAKFVIELERSMDYIPCLKGSNHEYLIEYPLQEKNIYEKCLDLLYFGDEHMVVEDAGEEVGSENEMEATLEENIEKVVETKLENLRLIIRRELKEIRGEIKEDLEEKIVKDLSKL